MNYEVFYREHITGDIKKSGKHIYGGCPLCEEKRPKFYANIENGCWDCKVCKEKGNLNDFCKKVKTEIPKEFQIDCNDSDAIITDYLASRGIVGPIINELIRKKKIRRYERRHSLSLVHIDWHQRPNDGPWVFTVEDDASRALLCLIECDSPTTEFSIHGMKEALQYGSIRQVLSDNGSQFTCNHPGHRKDSIFEQYCVSQGIKHIRTKPKHPQSNGKVEKWFDIYERHRDAFPDKVSFMRWYNHVRPHTALKWEVLETPWQAFKRKFKK